MVCVAESGSRVYGISAQLRGADLTIEHGFVVSYSGWSGVLWEVNDLLDKGDASGAIG